MNDSKVHVSEYERSKPFHAERKILNLDEDQAIKMAELEIKKATIHWQERMLNKELNGYKREKKEAANAKSIIAERAEVQKKLAAVKKDKSLVISVQESLKVKLAAQYENLGRDKLECIERNKYLDYKISELTRQKYLKAREHDEIKKEIVAWAESHRIAQEPVLAEMETNAPRDLIMAIEEATIVKEPDPEFLAQDSTTVEYEPSESEYEDESVSAENVPNVELSVKEAREQRSAKMVPTFDLSAPIYAGMRRDCFMADGKTPNQKGLAEIVRIHKRLKKQSAEAPLKSAAGHV